MKKKIFIFTVIILGLFLGAHFFNHRSLSSNPERVIVGTHEFKVDLATTVPERQRGLGGREELCPDCGMLFLFPEKGNYTFWMKNMKFNLDIIWILDNRIVYIAKDNPYEDISLIDPKTEADKVLEINAGLSDKYGLKVGDKVEIK